MSREYSQFKRGSLEMIVLLILKESDKYGYQITKEINNRSEGHFPLQEGSLYPVMYRLIENNYISSYYQTHNGRNRVYYHIENEGEERLEKIKSEYNSIALGIKKILVSTGEK